MLYDAVCSTLLTFSLNKLVFRDCLIDFFVVLLSSSRLCSKGIWLSICGCPQFLRIIFYRCLIQLFRGCPQFLKFIFYRCPTEPSVAVLCSSGSYSTGVQLSLWWLLSFPQDRILQVSKWDFCGCPQFLGLMFYRCLRFMWLYSFPQIHTGLFISSSGISELDCSTTKTDTAERSISIRRESLQVFFCTRGLGVLPVSTARR